jgi:hypothetical protein
MKKRITKRGFIIFSIVVVFIIGLTVWSVLKITDCDSTAGKCDSLSGSMGEKQISEYQEDRPSLPDGYTLDSYTIDKVTDESCNLSSDCETPIEYLVQSRCPFTSLCLQNKCTVVCPDVETMEFQGVITNIKPEKDGSILTVSNNSVTYEVLVSIPNLGEEYISSIKNIKVGKYIQVIGNVLKLKDSERIIASQIYVDGSFVGEHPCNLEPDPGNCKAAMTRYYFDKKEGECKEFLWGGCGGVVPFDNLDVCKNTCENVVLKNQQK